MILSDWYEQEYPEHARTSCSDEHPINAEVNGHGCWRCNAILFTHYDELVEEVKQLRKQLLDGQAQQDADKPACVSPMSDKPACGAQNAECERQRDAILQAIEEFHERLPSSFLTVINAIKRGDA